VPGWSDEAQELVPLRARLLEAGWDSAAVRVVDFRDPVGSNREHAREVARDLAEIRAATASPVVDVVAHSMGGLALRYHLSRQEPGGVDVRRAIFLATPHHGTWSALVAWGDGGAEMVPGSDFLMELMRGAPLPPGVEALTVRTPVDLHILPQESARLATVPDVEVCCPTHAGLVTDPRTFIVIEAFLVRGEVLRPPGLLGFGGGVSGILPPLPRTPPAPPQP
jgi:triacylglycerol lipase